MSKKNKTVPMRVSPSFRKALRKLAIEEEKTLEEVTEELAPELSKIKKKGDYFIP